MELHPIQLPPSNPLAADYLENFSRVAGFYRHPATDGWAAAVEERRGYTSPRAELAAVLREQHRRWGAGAASLENVDRLQQPHTLAVVTGQQAGIFGGPLYTFYKIMTTIRLAGHLQGQFPEFQFVPVFWLEVNDHDFKEINHICYITRENRLAHLSVPEAEEEAYLPIHRRRVSPALQEWAQALQEDFFDTEFKEEAIATFLAPYSGDTTYADAFARLMVHFFGEAGLVILNPADPAVAPLARPIFARAIESAEGIISVFRERNEELQQAGYPDQIHLRHNQVLLFYSDEEFRRARMEFDGKGQFVVHYPGGGEERLSREEALRRCRETPERFSPNVALRPLVQDHLLPTIAYVAGPSEIAYFAQLETLYRLLEIPMPVVYPRHRLTIVEGKIHRLVEKLGLDYAEVVQASPEFIGEYLRAHGDRSLFEATEAAEQEIEAILSRLEQTFSRADPTLMRPFKKTRQQIRDGFKRLSGRITRSLEEREKTVVQQLERVVLHLCPERHPQERVLNMIYFCIKYGVDFPHRLLEALPVESRSGFLVFL